MSKRFRGKGPPEERFWNFVLPEPNSGCWLWSGSLVWGGYGQFKVSRNTVRAHRFSYQFLVGPIPDGLHLDHKCRVRSCVNPDHLRPVTIRENNLLGEGPAAWNMAKTHCPAGHEYTPENTRIGGRNKSRFCRACQAEANRAFRIAHPDYWAKRYLAMKSLKSGD